MRHEIKVLKHHGDSGISTLAAFVDRPAIRFINRRFILGIKKPTQHLLKQVIGRALAVFIKRPQADYQIGAELMICPWIFLCQ